MVAIISFILSIIFIFLGIMLLKYKDRIFGYNKNTSLIRNDPLIRFGHWYVILSFVIGLMGLGIILILRGLSIIRF